MGPRLSSPAVRVRREPSAVECQRKRDILYDHVEADSQERENGKLGVSKLSPMAAQTSSQRPCDHGRPCSEECSLSSRSSQRHKKSLGLE